MDNIFNGGFSARLVEHIMECFKWFFTMLIEFVKRFYETMPI